MLQTAVTVLLQQQQQQQSVVCIPIGCQGFVIDGGRLLQNQGYGEV